MAISNLNLLFLRHTSIFEQLKIEEALLRVGDGNWCVINVGAPPAIVMGISGRPDELLDLPSVQRDNIPVIKRFSGGGTVVVDEDTLFVTFIMQGHPPSTPHAIMAWSEQLYSPLFPSEFALRENDYVLGARKCGGNAQYIRRGRWLHHTSFLWDFSEEKMKYLLLPKKRPAYRQDRAHADFLCTLKEHFASKEAFFEAFKAELGNHFHIEQVSHNDLTEVLAHPHRKSTELVFNTL